MATQEPDRGARRRWFRLPMPQSAARSRSGDTAEPNERRHRCRLKRHQPRGSTSPGVTLDDPAGAAATGRPTSAVTATSDRRRARRKRSSNARCDDSMRLPRVISIANQKGGVGKTTTAVNLGAALAEIGYRVLVVDLDPQGNATTGLGISHRNVEGSIYDVIMNDTPLDDCVEPTSVKNLFVVPGDHRPRRRRDRAGARVLPRAQAQARAAGCPRRLRLHVDRLPAVARSADRQRPRRVRRRARPDPVRVLRTRGFGPAPAQRRPGEVEPQPRARRPGDRPHDVRRPHPTRRCRSSARCGSTSGRRSTVRSCRGPSGSPRRRRSESPSSCSTRRLVEPSPTANLRRRSAVARPGGLGRGLGALIPTASSRTTRSGLQDIPIAVDPPESAAAARALRRGVARRARGVDPGGRRAPAGSRPGRRRRVRVDRGRAPLARRPPDRAPDDPGDRPHGRRRLDAAAGDRRERAARGAQPARGSRGVPAAHRGLLAHPRRRRDRGSGRAARPSRTP